MTHADMRIDLLHEQNNFVYIDKNLINILKNIEILTCHRSKKIV